MKAKSAKEVISFTDTPNVGVATAKDLEALGIKDPQHLVEEDAYILYKKLCSVTKMRHDPCVIDVFLAAIDFMEGAKAKPWWDYTKQRKLITSKM